MWYTRAILNVHDSKNRKIIALDGKIYDEDGKNKIERISARITMQMVNALMGLEFAEKDDYSYADIVFMITRVAMTLDKGVCGENYHRVWNTKTWDDRMDIVYDMCWKLKKMNESLEFPSTNTWVKLSL